MGNGCLSKEEACRLYTLQGSILILEWKHRYLKRKGGSKRQNLDRSSHPPPTVPNENTTFHP